MLSIWQSVTRTYIYILLTSGGLVVKYVPTMQELPYKVGDLGSIPESEERSPGEGNGNPLQYSCQENPMEKEPGGLQSMGSQESDMT